MEADFTSVLGSLNSEQSTEEKTKALDTFFSEFKSTTNLSKVPTDILVSLAQSIAKVLKRPEACDRLTESALDVLLVLTRDRRCQTAIMDANLYYLLHFADIKVREGASQTRDTISLRAVKCLCNLVFQSQATREAVEMLKSLEFESNYASLISRKYCAIEKVSKCNMDLTHFEFSLMFIYSAIASDSRNVFMLHPKISGSFSCVVSFLVENIENSSDSWNWETPPKSVLGNVLKAIYNLIANLDHETESEDIHDFLVSLSKSCDRILMATNMVNPKCMTDEDLLTHIYSIMGVMPKYALQACFVDDSHQIETNNDANLTESLKEADLAENDSAGKETGAINQEKLTGIVSEKKTDSLENSSSAKLSKWDENRSIGDVVSTFYSAIKVAVSVTENVTLKMAIFLALGNVCRSCRCIRKPLRHMILPPRKDVHVMPQEGGELKGELIRLMTGVNREVGELVSEFLFVLCKENVNRLLKYTGYGNAAGMMFTRGLGLRSVPASQPDYSDDEDTDTEEFKQYEHGFNYVTGRYEPPKKDPMEGMSEERKLVETEKLLNTLSRMQGTAMEPMTMGPDGNPVPLMGQLQRQVHEREDDNQSSGEDE